MGKQYFRIQGVAKIGGCIGEVVVSVKGDEDMISYMTEDDREVVETYNISDVRKI